MRLIDADAFLEKGFRICPASHMEIVDDDYCSYGERETNGQGLHGTEKHRLDVCSGEDEDDYSDCFYINAEITSHAVIDKEDRK